MARRLPEETVERAYSPSHQASALCLSVAVESQKSFAVVLPVGEVLSVGRDPEAGLTIDSPSLSRLHFAIEVRGDGATVRDLGSRNGTLLDGARLGDAPVPLPFGSEVIAGDGRFSLVRRASLPSGAEVWEPLATAPARSEVDDADVPAAFRYPSLRKIHGDLRRIAPRPISVLLSGETGTGKEVLARAIHEASPRKKRPFVVLDCGAVDAGLLSAELFGHERGAFTGAAGARRGKLAEADGGTLFIDEIGELPLDLQPKLLRALQSKEFTPLGASRPERFDARVVSATHRNLKKLVEDGKFRQDLFFRLSVVVATIPPLRDRSGDIPLLVTRLLEDIGAPLHLSDLPRGVLDVLRSYSWPGNVRELRNVLERLVALPDEPLDLVDSALPASLRGGASAAGGAPAGRERGGEALSWDPGLAALPLAEARGQVQERFLRWYLTAVLRECDGTVTRAALRMGVNRQYLHNLIRRCGLARGDFRDDDP